MAQRDAPARGAVAIATGVSVNNGEQPCAAVMATADTTVTTVLWANGTTSSGYIFQKGYNPIGVQMCTGIAGGTLWGLNN